MILVFLVQMSAEMPLLCRAWFPSNFHEAQKVPQFPSIGTSICRCLDWSMNATDTCNGPGVFFYRAWYHTDYCPLWHKDFIFKCIRIAQDRSPCGSSWCYQWIAYDYAYMICSATQTKSESFPVHDSPFNGSKLSLLQNLEKAIQEK